MSIQTSQKHISMIGRDRECSCRILLCDFAIGGSRANSLCRGREKRTMRWPEVQIGKLGFSGARRRGFEMRNRLAVIMPALVAPLAFSAVFLAQSNGQVSGQQAAAKAQTSVANPDIY